MNYERKPVSMPVGVWLVFDLTDRNSVYDFSVWRYQRGTRADELLISWGGNLQPETVLDADAHKWSVQHIEGWRPDRYIWVRLDDADLSRLTVAAQHGVFRRVAKAIWERIMA